MDIEKLYNIYLASSGVCTDSRMVKDGNLFFALKGENFDGNFFIDDALLHGAAACITENEKHQNHSKCIIVENVIDVLQQLAHHHRKQVHIPVIGITGTNGKTTTKELTAAILKSSFRTCATHGNFNNHLGVPLTLLQITTDTEIALIEMGANHLNDIAELCQIAEPTDGIITNIGRAHLAGFGDFEGVVEAKSKLYDYLRANNGTVFLNREDPLLTALAKGINAITYGKTTDVVLRGEIIRQFPFLELIVEKHIVPTHLVGSYNFDNVMAAFSIGLYFGVPIEKIIEAISLYNPTNNRSQQVKTAHNTLIMDCYNANPSSMKVALEDFGHLIAERKIAILGAMKEMGIHSEIEHKTLVDQALMLDLDQIFLIGIEFEPNFRSLKSHKNVKWFASTEELQIHLKNTKIDGATILIKGSRSIHLETIQQYL